MGYSTDLTLGQRNFIFENFPEILKTKSKADIFEHLAVDSNGFPLNVVTSRANIHDSKGATGLSINTISKYPSIKLLKTDNGYLGSLIKNLKEGLNVELECVKSNFGTSEFKPIGGRWVVERTFSWLETFSRLNRNYEQFLHTAKGLPWWRVQCLCCVSYKSDICPIYIEFSVAWVTIAPVNRHASASACIGHNATALLPHCANTSARRLTTQR